MRAKRASPFWKKGSNGKRPGSISLPGSISDPSTSINPVGKVPALIDDGVIVHDSTIINEYLEDKFPRNNLLPADPVERARARKFEDYADAYLMPSLFKIFWELRKPENERDCAKIAEGEREAQQHYALS